MVVVSRPKDATENKSNGTVLEIQLTLIPPVLVHSALFVEFGTTEGIPLLHSFSHHEWQPSGEDN
jgi:hypothetical protein